MLNKYDILLCDLDAFFASVEQVDHPIYKGKPVIIGGSPEGRGVVSTCSYEARKFGVHSAMPMKKALELCPQAVRLPGNMSRYIEISGLVRKIFEKYTPDIEIVSIDEAYLAVKKGTGYNTGISIRQTVREKLELPISVGVSVNKLLAKVACELVKPDNIGTLWPKDIAAVFWPLPVSVIPGIGPTTKLKLNQYGIKYVKDLAVFPPDGLVHILGRNAYILHQMANGIDDREIESEHEVKSISEEMTFPDDIYDYDSMLIAIQELSASVGYRLRLKSIKARTVTLKLRFKDFKTITRSKTLSEPLDSDSKIYRAARDLFRINCGKSPWRLVGVKASGFETGIQTSLLQSLQNEEKEKRLLGIKDRLRKKYGTEVLIPGRRLFKKKID